MIRAIWHKARMMGTMWWVVAFVLATAGVWQRFEVMRMARHIEETQRRITELGRVRDRLLAETSRLESRERIEAIAVNDLGLRPTTIAQRRTLLVDTTTSRTVASE
jgi:cell division protein FtsL